MYLDKTLFVGEVPTRVKVLDNTDYHISINGHECIDGVEPTLKEIPLIVTGQAKIGVSVKDSIGDSKSATVYCTLRLPFMALDDDGDCESTLAYTEDVYGVETVDMATDVDSDVIKFKFTAQFINNEMVGYIYITSTDKYATLMIDDIIVYGGLSASTENVIMYDDSKYKQYPIDARERVSTS